MVLLLLACAANFAEMKSARTLERGEMQVTQANTVVIPTSTIKSAIDPAKVVAERVQGDEIDDADKTTLVGGLVAVSLSSPGYGTYLDYGVGLGRGYDLSARMGNGIYALGVRKSVMQNRPWYGSTGLRAGYNSGGSWVGYLDAFNSVVDVWSLRRWDIQHATSFGVELGEWGRAWWGYKVIYSPYTLTIDATAIGLGKDKTSSAMWSTGGFLGGAIGFKYVHVAGEILVARTTGDLNLYDEDYSLKGWVISPSWGFHVTW
jgi:hypothetical protein